MWRGLAIISLLLVVSFCETTSQVDNKLESEYNEYLIKFNKEYKTAEERAMRLQIYAKNVALVEAHNNDASKSFKLGINDFTDWTDDEWNSMVSCDMKNTSDYVNSPLTYSDLPLADVEAKLKELPAEIDWRTKDIISPVKAQKKCGSCWAFCAVGHAESIYKMTHGTFRDLSEQQLVDCAGHYNCNGCGGGDHDGALHYIVDTNLMDTKEYPYEALDKPCRYNNLKGIYKLRGFGDVPPHQPVALMAALNLRPGILSIHAGTPTFKAYKSGIYENPECPKYTNHCMQIIGYGFDAPSQKSYWILKNSWGAEWGDGGYMKIIRRPDVVGPGECHMLNFPSFGW